MNRDENSFSERGLNWWKRHGWCDFFSFFLDLKAKKTKNRNQLLLCRIIVWVIACENCSKLFFPSVFCIGKWISTYLDNEYGWYRYTKILHTNITRTCHSPSEMSKRMKFKSRESVNTHRCKPAGGLSQIQLHVWAKAVCHRKMHIFYYFFSFNSIVWHMNLKNYASWR